MPRGIGKHYCAFNLAKCYSSSGVDLYDDEEKASEEVLLNLWLFFNSSLFWLLREISGRKNLGGGMLKSEAIDLKSLPVYMDFNKYHEIKEIFDSISSRKVLSTVNEIKTQEHIKIDKMIFDYLGLDELKRENILKSLLRKIRDRERRAYT